MYIYYIIKLVYLFIVKIDDEEKPNNISLLSHMFHILPQTVQLNLTANNIGTNGVKTLSQYLTVFTNLKSLKISNNNIGNKGMLYLSHTFSAISKLEELSLGSIILYIFICFFIYNI